MARTRQNTSMTQAEYEVFRTELKNIRKANGLSAAEVGELTGFSSQYIYNIENGQRLPNNDVVKKLTEVFGLDVSEMLMPHEERFKLEAKKAGRELIHKRIARGFSIDQVARFLGLPKEAYLNYENGQGIMGDSLKEAIDLLYAVDVKTETVEVIKEVVEPCPIGLDAISLILDHLAEMNISTENKRLLFRELSEIKMAMLEKKLFG